MTTTHIPNLPVPTGATADDWSELADGSGEFVRFLTWSKHDTSKVGVAVGEQYADGRVDWHVSLYDTTCKELTAEDARELAAALIAAADELDRLT